MSGLYPNILKPWSEVKSRFPRKAVKMYVQRQISNDVPPGATIKLLKHGIKIEI